MTREASGPLQLKFSWFPEHTHTHTDRQLKLTERHMYIHTLSHTAILQAFVFILTVINMDSYIHKYTYSTYRMYI